MSETHAPRVIVIGAGLEGLAAAHVLEREQVRVTLLEPRTAEQWAAAPEGSAQALAVLPALAPAWTGLGLELGIGSALRTVPVITRVPGALLRGSLDSGMRAGRGARLPIEWVRERRLRRLLRWYGPWLDAAEPERAGRLDDRSAADFCRLYLGAGRASLALLRGLELWFGLDPEEASRVALLLLLDGFGELALQASPGVATLREALAKPRRDLRFGVGLREVAADGRSVRLESGDRIRGEAVLVTRDLAVLRPALSGLSPAEDVVLGRVRSLDRVLLRVWLRGAAPRATDVLHAIVPHDPRSPLAGIIDATPLVGAQGAAGGEGRRVLVLAARSEFAASAARMPDGDVAAVLRAHAETLHPGLLAAIEDHALERAPGSVPMLRVGVLRDAERLRREAHGRAQRRLFLVGAGLAGSHPEAALAAGLRVASECLEALRTGLSSS